MKVRPFRPEDLDVIVPLEAYEDPQALSARVREAYAEGKLGSVGTMLFDDGRPVAILGWQVINEKTADIWTITGKDITEHFFGYCKASKQIFQHNWELNQHLRRAQITCRADQPWAERWATFLGFEKEALMRAYGPEAKDYFLFAKVRE